MNTGKQAQATREDLAALIPHEIYNGWPMDQVERVLDCMQLALTHQALAAFEAAPQQEPVAWLYEAWFQDQGEGGDSRWMPQASPCEPEESMWTRNIRPLYAAPQQAQAPGWQPIETAPKIDNAEILLLVDGEPLAGHWYVIPFIEYRDEAGCFVDQQDDDEGWMTYRDGPGVEPTHWMPIPAAPQQGSKS